MTEDYFVKNRETVQVVPYALYDTCMRSGWMDESV